MLIGIVIFGTCAYYFVEKMPLFEAFYMTMITISTLGYAEILLLSPAGRDLTIIIIILGITVGAITIGLLVNAFIEGELLKMAGNMIFNPMPSETLEAGDVIVVIGKKEDLKRMNAVM